MKKFEITQEQINILCCGMTPNKELLLHWFPEAFEKPLEVGVWYKTSTSLFCFQEGNKSYGINNGSWIGWTWIVEGEQKDWNPTKATPQEVETALIAEAKKRGFVDGIYFIEPINLISFDKKERLANGFIEMYNSNSIRFSKSSSLIYKDGIWATIVETITKEEAEKLLNKKIV